MNAPLRTAGAALVMFGAGALIGQRVEQSEASTARAMETTAAVVAVRQCSAACRADLRIAEAVPAALASDVADLRALVAETLETCAVPSAWMGLGWMAAPRLARVARAVEDAEALAEYVSDAAGVCVADDRGVMIRRGMEL